MKKRFVIPCVILLILCAIAWLVRGKQEAANKPVSSVTTKERNHAAARSDPSHRAGSEAPDGNQRTRPSQAPPDRVYAKPKVEMPVAEAVKGKPGFVLSPFNGKIIDVNHIPPGTLVADPTYPVEEKKYFRVPEQN